MRLFLLIFLLACATLPAQRLDNRIAVANSRASKPALQPVLFTFDGDVSHLFLRAAFSDQSLSDDDAAWEFSLHQNLVHSSGLRLRLIAQNADTVSAMKISLRFGMTWYTATVPPLAEGQWQDLFIPKTDFLPEDAPCSWMHCTAIRLSASPKKGGQLTIQLAQLEFMRPNAPIAILRSGTTAEAAARSYPLAKTLGKALAGIGLRVAAIEDEDCLMSHVKLYSAFLLPDSIESSNRQTTAVSNLLRRGSTVGVFHQISPIVAAHLAVSSAALTASNSLPTPLVAIHTGTGQESRRLAFRHSPPDFMAIHAIAPTMTVTDWWADASGRITSCPAIVKTQKGFWMTSHFLEQDSQNGAIRLLKLMDSYAPGLLQAATTQLANNVQQGFSDAPSQEQKKLVPTLTAVKKLLQGNQLDAAMLFALRCQQQLQGTALPPEPPRSLPPPPSAASNAVVRVISQEP